MLTRIDKETLDFMSKKKLSFNQFCICLLIHNRDVAGIIQYTDRIGFLGSGTKVNPDKTEVKEITDLINRGFLRHAGTDKQNYYSLDNFDVTEKFTGGLIINAQKAVDEL